MDNLLVQIQQGEGAKTEFKSSFQKEVIESVVAFANATGGKVFIGVNDYGEIIGVELQKESQQNWLNEIKQNTSPSVIPDISVEQINGKCIVIIETKEYPIKPISYKHRYLLRRANANHVMSMEEIANEYLKTKNSSWDYYIDSTQNFNNLSLEKIERFIQKIEVNQGKKFADTPMKILQKYSLAQDDKITFGAYLLFVTDFCLISGIQAGRFKTAIDIIDSLSLNADILTEIDELMVFIKKHLMVEYIITGNPQREQRYDYPIEAIREVVLNMIVHRDYRDSSDSIIKIFDDRIEFYNPGELYDNQTIDELNSNQYKSKTRNKLIALMFKECGLIEKYGSGITRIKQYCVDHGIQPPRFESHCKGFKVTLYKGTTQETTQKTTQETTQETKVSTKERICQLIVENNHITRIELAKVIGVSEEAIKQQIAKLKKEGRLERIGSTKAGYWQVIK